MSNKVYDSIKAMALQLSQGEKLSSERDLAKQYEVARNTVVAILNELEGEGFIWRKAKSGWFKSPNRLVYNPDALYTFNTTAQNQGFDIFVEVLNIGMDASKTFDAEFNAEDIIVIERRKVLDGRPVMLEKTYVISADVPNLSKNDLTQSTTDIFARQYDFDIDRMDVDIKSHTLNPTESQYLLCSVGLPSLIIRRTLYQENRIKQIEIEIWRFDAIQLSLKNISY